MSTRYNALLAAFFLLLSSQLHASTVLEMSFSDVTHSAELIFEGRVLELEARQSGKAILTHVTFEILDVVKGDYAGDTIELSFLGGSVNGRHLKVTEMDFPQPGETGFYFVESLRNNLVHPLVGWDQGRYLIERGRDGVGRVTSAAHQPVREVRSLPQPVDPATLGKEYSKGIAKGVIVQDMLTDAMTAAEFRDAVREVMQQGMQENSR